MKSLVAIFSTALLAASAYAADAPKAPKVDIAKGAETYANTCAACHGEDGNSIIALQPTLAQQHPEYLVKQLADFKSGAREDAVMQGMSGLLSDEDMQNVAAWLATKKAKPGTASADLKTMVAGERIYRGGIPDRSIPACAACHSPNGAGLPSQYPRLSGLHPEYLVKQLTAFRSGARHTNQTMVDVAAKMNDREIKAVSDYIAGLR